MNVFIISSPLQAINAIEAINFFQLIDNKILIVFGQGAKENKAVIPVLKMLGQNDYSLINVKSLFNLYINFKKYFPQGEVSKIFVGNYYNFSHRIIMSKLFKKKTEIFLLDDGNSTLIWLKNNYRSANTNKQFKIIIKELFSNKVLGIEKKIKKVKCFSLFVTEDKDKGFYKNNLLFLKHLKKQNQKLSSMHGNYIVGSIIVELGLLTFKEYDELIKKVVINNDSPIYYIPHRREDKNKICNLSSYPLLTILNSKLTIELDFIINGMNPKSIWGFGSAALYTLHKLYPFAEIYNIEWYKAIEDNNIRKVYELITDFYRSINIGTFHNTRLDKIL